MSRSIVQRFLAWRDIVGVACNEAPSTRFPSPNVRESTLHWRGSTRAGGDRLDSLSTHDNGEIPGYSELLYSAFECGVMDKSLSHQVENHCSIRRDLVEGGVHNEILGPYALEGLGVAV